MDAGKTRLDAAKKDQRTREKDLEVVQAKRSKTEGRLYEVKTNKEYSAVLAEIEEIKQEKGRVEEEILVLMESQERLTADIKDAEARFKTRETQGKQEEAALQEKLRAVEADLALVRTERAELARAAARRRARRLRQAPQGARRPRPRPGGRSRTSAAAAA